MDKELKDLLREVSMRLLEAEILYDNFPLLDIIDERKINSQTLEKVQEYLTKNK